MMKRKLATISAAFAAGILLALVLLPKSSWLHIAALSALLSLLILAAGRAKANLIAALCCISVSCALLWCAVYERYFCEPVAAYDGTTTQINAVVIQAPVKTDYGTYLVVRIEGIGFAGAKAKMYVYGTDLSGVECGTEITASVRMTYTLGDDYEGSLSLPSKGFYLTCSTSAEIQLLGKAEGWFWYFPARFAARLKVMIKEVFPEDTAAFITALLTGDTYELELDSVLSNILSIAGIYHICSVSGLHVMFLASIIRLICPGRRISAIVTIIFVTVFAALTGFPSSVIRASLMLFAGLIAPLLNREADSLTSLCGALLILLIVNPWSVFSAGLQLSFAATLGIILLSNRFSVWLRGLFENTAIYRFKLVKFIINSQGSVIGTSIGATALTIPVSMLWFKSVSLFAPVTNFLVMWLVSLTFYLSAGACALGFLFLPAGRLFGHICAWPVRLICFVAEAVSGNPSAVVYASNPLAVLWIVLLYLAIVLLICLKGNWRHTICVTMAAAAAFTVLTIGNTVSHTSSGLSVTVLDVGQGQCIVLRDSGFTAVIDCGSSSVYDAGDTAALWLAAQGEGCVDVVMFTHFDSDHSNGAADLFARQKVGALAMPQPGAADGNTWPELEDAAGQYGIDITYVDARTEVQLGTTLITMYPPVDYGTDNSGMVILASSGDFDVLVTGDITSSSEKKLMEMYSLPDIELLVVGHHGSYYSTSESILDELKPEAAVISVGENTYGHPNEDVLRRLGERGIEIYRTDIDGTLTFTPEEG